MNGSRVHPEMGRGGSGSPVEMLQAVPDLRSDRTGIAMLPKRQAGYVMRWYWNSDCRRPRRGCGAYDIATSTTREQCGGDHCHETCGDPRQIPGPVILNGVHGISPFAPTCGCFGGYMRDWAKTFTCGQRPRSTRYGGLHRTSTASWETRTTDRVTAERVRTSHANAWEREGL